MLIFRIPKLMKQITSAVLELSNGWNSKIVKKSRVISE
jgi:hypothetical protein